MSSRRGALAWGVGGEQVRLYSNYTDTKGKNNMVEKGDRPRISGFENKPLNDF